MNALHKHWRSFLLGGALLGVLALARFVSVAPVQWSIVRIDSLAVFFALATLAALALTYATPGNVSRRAWLCAVLLLAAYSVTLTSLIALLFTAVAIVSQVPSTVNRQPSIGGRLAVAAQRVFKAAPLLVAAAALLVGYTALALNGALHYDDHVAGAALNSVAFWFVLLAAIVPLLPLGTRSGAPAHLVTLSPCHLVSVAWLYPIVRLYSLGPWNTGWSYATLLFGGAAALWLAIAALTEVEIHVRARHIRHCFAALALAGFGLDTSAGIAAGCYAVVALLVVQPGARSQEPGARSQEPGARSTGSPVFTLIAPFVAVWMLIGAATACGASALALVAWFAALISALALMLGNPARSTARALRCVGTLSLALGIGAPLVVLWLIEPVIEQLQGGLTPYGDVVIWPWVGLAIKNSANTQVAVLPSLVVAVLLLVLAAIVYLVARMHTVPAAPDALAPTVAKMEPAHHIELVEMLRAEVPWLDLLLPAKRNKVRRIDGE